MFENQVWASTVSPTSFLRLKRRQQERSHAPGHVDGQFRMAWKRLHRALALAVTGIGLSTHVHDPCCRALFFVRYVDTDAAMPTISSASSLSSSLPSRTCLPISEA